MPRAGRCRWQCLPRPESRRGRSAAGRHRDCHGEAAGRSVGLSATDNLRRDRTPRILPIPARYAAGTPPCQALLLAAGQAGGWVTWATQARLVMDPDGPIRGHGPWAPSVVRDHANGAPGDESHCTRAPHAKSVCQVLLSDPGTGRAGAQCARAAPRGLGREAGWRVKVRVLVKVAVGSLGC